MMKRRPLMVISIAAGGYCAMLEDRLGKESGKSMPKRAHNREVELPMIGFGALVLMG